MQLRAADLDKPPGAQATVANEQIHQHIFCRYRSCNFRQRINIIQASLFCFGAKKTIKNGQHVRYILINAFKPTMLNPILNSASHCRVERVRKTTMVR